MLAPVTTRTPDRKRRLVLVGMMGAGKTAVGRAVAAHLGWPFLDNDELVAELAGRPADEVAATRGVGELHRLERLALERVLAHPGPLVASAAGSVVDNTALVSRLHAAATVAWLRARPETLLERVGDGAGRRDDARSATWTRATLARREASFATAADLVIDTDGREVDDIAADLVATVLPEGPGGHPR
jgi:shikimate kinase